jgi:hypothetical protein
LSLVGTIVAKGKGRASLKPLSIAALQAESKESTTTDFTLALAKEFKGQVSSKQLQALRKQVVEQEEYTCLF